MELTGRLQGATQGGSRTQTGRLQGANRKVAERGLPIAIRELAEIKQSDCGGRDREF
jgi:hypothetical protein